MKIIIVGLGKTGVLLADTLSKEHHDVTVIDSDKTVVESTTDRLPVSGVVGSGASKHVLLAAGADTADLVVALTPSDEANLMTCQIAKKLGTKYTATRFLAPEFADDKEYLTSQFDIDYIVNPKYDVATEIERQIGLPGLVKADAFFSNDVVIIKITVDKNSSIVGKALRDVTGVLDAEVLVGAVLRDDKISIPNGNFVVEVGDVVDLILPQHAVHKVIAKLGLVRKPVKRVFIVGGGTIGCYLAENLLAEGKRVTILDNDKKRCAEILEMLPKADVAYLSAVDSDILEEEGIKDADVCISLTGEDEKNLVISMFAWSCGIPSIITKVDLPAYEKLLNKVNMDITISPTVISANMLMSFIRNITVFNEKGNDINRITSIAGGRAEAIEFIAYDNCKKLGIALKSPEFGLKKDLLLAAIIRNNKVIVPSGNSKIAVGDKVIVMAKTGHGLNTLNDIFK